MGKESKSESRSGRRTWSCVREGAAGGTRAEVALGIADAEVARDSYAPRAFVDEGAVETIHLANVTFLGLVARRSRASAAGPFGVAPDIAARVARLDERGRRRAAQCPYTLFNLRFEDAAFWRTVAGDAAEPVVESPDVVGGVAPPASAVATPTNSPVATTPAQPSHRQVRPVLEVAAGDAHVAVFALKAVFLAWHLARNSDGIAAVALGMTPPVIESWRRMPLSALDRCAGAALPYLAARWGANARFWEPLLDAAERAGANHAELSGAEHAERVRLLGLQLLAADGCRHALPKRTRR